MLPVEARNLFYLLYTLTEVRTYSKSLGFPPPTSPTLLGYIPPYMYM